ncbi:MAG: ATP-dependent helicase [Solirubrobacterales bacterium]|nr:ATP-dependent helicase [Solirubrobacterales bacterium]
MSPPTDHSPDRAGATGPGRAVDLERGALLLTGPAGTGKSSALRERVVRLTGERGLDPSRVAVVTSTVRAAGEHRTELERRIEQPFEEVVALTWEDFAERLLRRWPVESGTGPGFEVVGRAERLAMLLVRLDELPLRNHQIRGNPAALLRSLIARIDRIRQEGAPVPADLAGLVEAHDRILGDLGLIDRTDLPRLAAGLLTANDPVAAAVTDLHPHLVIDELEDLTPTRAELLAVLAERVRPESVVASIDPDRARFGPGAEARFEGAFPGVERAEATVAWRLPPGRITVARAILGESAAADWEPGSGEQTAMPVRFWRSGSPQAEAQAVAREIEHRLAGGATPNGIAIAVPDVDLSGGKISATLAERGIPTRLGGGALFRQPEVRDTMAWLGALCDPTDARAVTRALTRPPTGLRSVDLATLTTIAKRRKIDLVDACEAALESPRMPPEARQRLEAFLALYRAAARVLDSRRPDEFVRRLIERVGFRRQRLFAARPETAERLLGLSRLADLATAFSRREPLASTRDFSRYLYALADGGLSVEPVAGLPDTGGVPILDLDGIKGREWDWIYVLGLDGSEPIPRGALATAVTSAGNEVVLSRVGPEPSGINPGDPVRAALDAGGAIEEIHDEELFGPGEDLHAGWRVLRDEVVEASWRTGSELNEPRLDTPEDVNRAVARYLELLKLAALAQRPAGGSDREAIEAINGLLGQVATPAQLAELDRSTLDSWLLAGERDREDRRRLSEARREPSLAAFLPRRGDDLRLSATDLDLYLTCPLKYKFARVFAIPRPPTVNMRFGILIHNVLQRFHEPALVGGPDRGGPESGALAELLEDGWRRGGFGDSDDELQFLDRARQAMRTYEANERASEAVPVHLERQFEFRIGSHWLRGRVDRVDRLPDGSHEVVDYKTGERIESERHGGDLQLALYRLGAAEAWNLEIGSGAYYYVMEGIRETVVPEPDDRERVERTVLEVGEGVLTQDFEPKPSPSVCSWCDFRLVCPAAEA